MDFNFKEGGKEQVKPDTSKHTHSWDNTNFFCYSILDRCYHLDGSKGLMNITLNGVSDKVLTGKKKNQSFQECFFLT